MIPTTEERDADIRVSGPVEEVNTVIKKIMETVHVRR